MRYDDLSVALLQFMVCEVGEGIIIQVLSMKHVPLVKRYIIQMLGTPSAALANSFSYDRRTIEIKSLYNPYRVLDNHNGLGRQEFFVGINDDEDNDRQVEQRGIEVVPFVDYLSLDLLRCGVFERTKSLSDLCGILCHRVWDNGINARKAWEGLPDE